MLFLALLLAGVGSVGAQELKDGDFEGAFDPVVSPPDSKGKIDGEIAEGWRDESAWGDVSIAYSQDPTGGHNATSAQKIEVRAQGKGAPQFVQELPVEQGAVYRITAWVKSASPARGSLAFRQAGSPYAVYGSTNINLTTTWTQVVVTGTASAGGNALIMFLPEGTGTYWIDDVTFQDAATIQSLPAAATGAGGGVIGMPLTNGDFEGNFSPYAKSPQDKAQIEGELADGWKDDSGWADVSVAYARDTTVSNSGKAAQRIDVRAIKKGGVQFQQEVLLKKGRIYRFSFYARSLINTQAEVQIRQKAAPYNIFGSLTMTPSPEWRKFEVYAQMDRDEDVVLNFSPAEATTYWLDDAKLEDVTDSSANGTARQGNLLDNGSFEAGYSEGWNWQIAGFDNNVIAASREHLDLRGTIDTSTAADGKKSATLSVLPWSVGLFSSPTVPAKFAQTYTASIAIRSSVPAQATLVLAGTMGHAQVDVGPEWKRYSVSGTAVLGSTVQLAVNCSLRDAAAPVQFWLDSAMLEEGSTASPSYVAPFPVELALTMQRPGCIVFDGEAALFQVATGGDLPKGASLKWSVEDLEGKVTKLPALAFPVTRGTIAPDADFPRGVFKVRAQVFDPDGKALSAEVQKLFTRLPHPRELTEAQTEKSYFGAHIELVPEKLDIAKATGNHWLRLHDVASVTQWPNVAANPGEWTWNDEGIKAARAEGFNLLGLLAGAPNRVALHPQAQTGYFSSWNVPDAPGALDEWNEYVKQTVAHYHAQINHWEIWNEPYINGASSGFFPKGTPEQYAELLKRASTVIRQTSPETSIVGVCSPGSDPAWLNRVLSVTGPSYYDEMSFHAYGGRLQGGAKSQIGEVVDGLNAVQARYGTAKPLWETEGGPTDNLSWYVSPTNEMRLQMTSIVRLDVDQLAAHIAVFFPYTMCDSRIYGRGNLNWLEYDRSLKPVTAARAVLASLVDGATYAGRTEPQPGAEIHTFRQSDGSSIEVAWGYDSTAHTLDVPEGMKALDILGNSLKGTTVKVGEEPVYFVGK